MLPRFQSPATIQGILRVFTYSVGSLLIIVGILFVSGIRYFGTFPSQLRVMFGIVLILYGAYRIVSTYTRHRHETDLPL